MKNSPRACWNSEAELEAKTTSVDASLWKMLQAEMPIGAVTPEQGNIDLARL